MCKFWVSIIFSLLAIIVSWVAIAVSLPRIELGIDYIGVISLVLSFSLTLLIGWNIYSIIDLKRLNKKYKILEKEAERNNNYMHNKIDFNNGLSMCFNAIGLACSISKESEEHAKYQMILQGAGGLKILSNLQEFEMCNCVAGIMMATIDDTKHIILNKVEVSELVSVLKEIPNMDKICRLFELINKVQLQEL